MPKLIICSIFGKLDINGDGELDEVEFIGGCLDDSELVRLLNGSKVGQEKIFFFNLFILLISKSFFKFFKVQKTNKFTMAQKYDRNIVIFQ